MLVPRHHAEWLTLVESSGPFLSMPVLLQAFPQGLDEHADRTETRARLRSAHEEWREAQSREHGDPAIHRAWVRFVLREVLDWEDALLVEGPALPAPLRCRVAEHGETLIPDLALINPPHIAPGGGARLLVQVVPAGQDLDRPLEGRRWKASPATRAMELLHASAVRLGLVTNGEHWMLAHAPAGETTGFASFYASLWFDEDLTLRAFRSLLAQRRFFGVAAEETIEALYERSAQDQQEVTDQLGFQVRAAVELLIQAIDRIDRDRGRKLLAGVDERELYRAALTVMMRLVLVLTAEERKLLPLGDALYDQHYAVSTLWTRLRDSADRQSDEVLERQYDAWNRLLAAFRAVHGGIAHDALRLPPYGGSLFDPDRYPFLEGRAWDTRWRETPADPLPINNRTVLHLLESLEFLRVRLPGGGQAERRRLSFRSLDVEQIGHVYEGLLDHTAVRADGPVLGLAGTKEKEPEIRVDQLDLHRAEGDDRLVSYLRDETKRSPSALRRCLEYVIPPEDPRWMVACENSADLLEAIRPYAGLVRDDAFGAPVVIGPQSVYVTQGTERRKTGTHYTPKVLAESLVRHALDPLVYAGPAEGKPPEEWKLRPAREILGLRVLDPAMGSGAFLVQACRYLSERLVEAWEVAEKASGGGLVVTPEGELANGSPREQLVPRGVDERLVLARRLVADRCLFGVDRDPMAVEMAKLSLWLVTLQRERPFTFLDHALRCGDSLLGLTQPEQIAGFHIAPGERTQIPTLARHAEAALAQAVERRRCLEGFTVRDPRDAAEKARLLREAETVLDDVRLVADLVIAAALSTATAGAKALERELASLSAEAAALFSNGGPEQRHALARRARELLDAGRRPEHPERRTFHWPLEFPEVFLTKNGAGGFDAVVGNPPFKGGQHLTGLLGNEYRDYLVQHIGHGQRGSADLCAYFFLRGAGLLRPGGMLAMLATNTIAQGDTREVGLEQLAGAGFSIPRAVASRKWPGSASVEVAHVWLRRGEWRGAQVLDDREARGITPFLAAPGRATGKPFRLAANAGKSFQGSIVLGMGFIMTPEEAKALRDRDPRNGDVLFPYLNGEDLNSRWDQSASRWVINFRDWPLDRTSAPPGYAGPLAADYPECLAIVREKVKPEREGKKYSKTARERWWLYERWRDELYGTIAGMERVLVVSLVTHHVGITFVLAGQVFAHRLAVFPFPSAHRLAVLQSGLHEPWAREYSSSLETRLNYSPSDCFETFPFPADLCGLDDVGQRYDAHRRSIMAARQEGLTKTYNRFHDKKEDAEDIRTLRELHVEMDEAVARAYGWDDLRLEHGFHQTKQGLRFTISEAARREVLDRLLELNHQRHAEEVAQGLHARGPKRKGGKGRTTKTKAQGPKNRELFEDQPRERGDGGQGRPKP